LNTFGLFSPVDWAWPALLSLKPSYTLRAAGLAH
jgi:hypothetical protein